jgi:hypothetical protein
MHKAIDDPNDLSFPVSYHEHARYLKLADLYLALDERSGRSSKVIPIDRGKQVQNRKTRKAA